MLPMPFGIAALEVIHAEYRVRVHAHMSANPDLFHVTGAEYVAHLIDLCPPEIVLESEESAAPQPSRFGQWAQAIVEIAGASRETPVFVAQPVLFGGTEGPVLPLVRPLKVKLQQVVASFIEHPTAVDRRLKPRSASGSGVSGDEASLHSCVQCFQGIERAGPRQNLDGAAADGIDRCFRHRRGKRNAPHFAFPDITDLDRKVYAAGFASLEQNLSLLRGDACNESSIDPEIDAGAYVACIAEQNGPVDHSA